LQISIIPSVEVFLVRLKVLLNHESDHLALKCTATEHICTLAVLIDHFSLVRSGSWIMTLYSENIS